MFKPADQQEIMELKEKVAALERERAETRMGFAPFEVDSNISAFEFAKMKAILAERDHLLKVANERTAEIIVQKTNLYNQLQHEKAERERVESVLTQIVEVLNTGEEAESRDIVRRITDILTPKLFKREDEESSVSRGAQVDTDDQVMDESFSIEFVDKQTCLDKGVDHLMQQIKDKEELLLKASESQKDVDESTKQHTQEMISLQQRIDVLLAEEAKLEADSKKKPVSSRLAEERRRKLLEVKKQLAQFRKHLNELEKLERQKQQSEETQERMQAEFAALKMISKNHSMVKQRKEDSETNRLWKPKHDRELVQIKQKKRKRDFEAAEEEGVHDQQMLECKQKLEEARTVNKRLQAQDKKKQTRVRSMAFLETAITTTEEERRTRSSRHGEKSDSGSETRLGWRRYELHGKSTSPKESALKETTIMKPCLGMSDELRKEFPSWIPPEIISAYAENVSQKKK
ncbi:hypothetical protein Q1695_010746 [Nippostrongylus brasiliensis]|nr:hypothetical protein Q1695_010746 [Nippostrongylus brasiliensis]